MFQISEYCLLKGRFTKDHVYKHQDIIGLVEYARIRGIRVIPEFDSPGHVAAFGKSFPGSHLYNKKQKCALLYRRFTKNFKI